jgi:hypothetical protein
MPGLIKICLPLTEEGEAQDYQMHYAKLDSCSLADICAGHLLHNIKSSQEYGRPSIRMKMAHGKTPWYDQCGELHALDEHDRIMKRIYYVQATPVHGDKDFILTGMNTILDLNIDIMHHMKTSLEPGIRRLRRGGPKRHPKKRKINLAKGERLSTPDKFVCLTETTRPDHGPGNSKNGISLGQEPKGPLRLGCRTAPHSTKKSPRSRTERRLQARGSKPPASILCEECCCSPRVALSMSYQEYLRFLNDSNILSNKELQAKFPSLAPITSEEETSIPPEDLICLMTEIQLQAILDNQVGQDGELDVDMTTNEAGDKISKFDIKAISLGKAVSPAMIEAFYDFCQKYVGDDNVFVTRSKAPKVLTPFVDNPFKFVLRDEYVTGPRPKAIPSIRATYYHGKPATRRVLEHFVRTTPVVSRCDHPRCLSRLVIVPKREPGTPKDSAPTSYRVTMNALVNNCLKPTASTTPLATDEIKKLHHHKYFLQLDGSQAYWSIPIDEESKRLLAFQTHEGVFAWDRLTMGARPSSAVQQTAYIEILDRYLDPDIR